VYLLRKETEFTFCTLCFLSEIQKYFTEHLKAVFFFLSELFQTLCNLWLVYSCVFIDLHLFIVSIHAVISTTKWWYTCMLAHRCIPYLVIRTLHTWRFCEFRYCLFRLFWIYYN